MAVVRVGGFPTVNHASPQHPKVLLVSPEARLVCRFPIAPVLTYSGIAQRSSTYDRVGRKPVLSMLGENIRTISFSALIVGRDGNGNIDAQTSVESNLHNLRAMARSGARCAFENFGPSSIGWWRVTDLSVTDRRRQHLTNHLTQAEVTFTLTEAVESVTYVGPLSGGAAPAPAAAPEGGPSKATRTHTVAAGETLAGIALRYYGDASKFGGLAYVNGIANPALIRVGQVLIIYPNI